MLKCEKTLPNFQCFQSVFEDLFCSPRSSQLLCALPNHVCTAGILNICDKSLIVSSLSMLIFIPIFGIVYLCITVSYGFTISQIYGEELLSQWNVYVSGPYGSKSVTDGEFFTDFRQSLNGRSVRPDHWPDSINIRSGDSIDAIQVTYGNYRGRLHGWQDGGDLHKIKLYQADRIVKVSGRRGLGPGASVDQLTFHTEHGNTFGPYGGPGGYAFTAKPPKSECFLGWISGYSNLRLDAISFHWRCPINYDRPPDGPINEDLHIEESWTISNTPDRFESSFLMLIATLCLLHLYC